MGMSLKERIDSIFSDVSNFENSGICDPELVTVDLARDLMKAYSAPGGLFRLIRAGYGVHVFGTGTGESGILDKWIGSGRKRRHLVLYWDQRFPAENEARRKAEAEEKEAKRDE